MQYSQNLHTLGSLMAYLVFFSLMHIWPIDIFSQISPVWSTLISKSLIKRGLTQPIGDMSLLANSHVPVKLTYPKPCFYCRHVYDTSDQLTTTFKWSFCVAPLHKSTYKRPCWKLHIINGLPTKRRLSKK